MTLKNLRWLVLASAALLWACQKDGFITSGDAGLRTSTDSLFFDTVFTSVGSVTQQIIVANTNNQKLRIARIALGGGASSAFSLNVNGQPGTSFSQLEMNADDSLYMFIKLTVNPTATNLPFLIRDSITLEWNGNRRTIKLEAYGQNARFLKNWRITKDTTWTAEQPFVLVNQLTVDAGATLTLQKGCKIYCNATAPFVVNGSLRCLGRPAPPDWIVFRGDRTDALYKDLPGGWQGLIFTASSSGNLLQNTHILNAYQGILVGGGANQNPAKLTLEACQITNAFDLGLYALNSSVAATNCLIAQCGNNGEPGVGGSNVILAGGGTYRFNHCTIATYANLYQNHKQPALYITNAGGGTPAALDALFTNSIVHGGGGLTEDELVVNRVTGPAFLVQFQNLIYRAKNAVAHAAFANAQLNVNPQFDSISTSRQTYNFRLRAGSPAIDTAAASTTSIDLDGNPRPFGRKPDLGCYEHQ
ncbi:MAG: hypothetical protein EAY75_12565 [Bacteroidetes bacterium]|nr:MAG: hypothetical protein EAY75_12565 [Bacteroidota bacterium]